MQGAQGPTGPATIPIFNSGTVNLVFFQSTLPSGWTAITNEATVLNDKILRVVSSSSSNGGNVTSVASKNFTNIFTVNYSTEGHTLTVSQIPPHSHPGTASIGGNAPHSHPHSHPLSINTDGDNAPHSHPVSAHNHNLFGNIHSGGGGDTIAGQILADRFSDSGRSTEYNLKRAPNQSADSGVSGAGGGGNISGNAPHDHNVSGTTLGNNDGDNAPHTHTISSVTAQGGGLSHSHTIDLDINYINVIIGSRNF